METLFKTQVPQVAATRGTSSKYIALVEKIYAADNKNIRYNGTIESLLWEHFAQMSKTRNTWKRATFKTLLLHLYAEGCYAVLRSPVYVKVLANIATFGLKMVRPIEKWKRPSFVPDEQLEDLIDHCFATYPTPVFLATAFYDTSLSRMLWYVKVGSGAAIKSLPNYPEHFTAKMTHIFRNTPKGFSIDQALIRAEALGYGASPEMAERMAWSRLTEVAANGMFWSTVIQFFAKTNVDHNTLRTLLEYLASCIAANANYSLKGRTLQTVQRDAAIWHEHMQKRRDAANEVDWEPSDIQPLYFEGTHNGKRVSYRTVELLTADELYQEGTDMNHCIADYIDDCHCGDSSVFSLRRYDGDTFKKLATIEINPVTKVIIEAQGNCNTDLSDKAIIALRAWAKQGHVKMHEHSLEAVPYVPPVHQNVEAAPAPIAAIVSQSNAADYHRDSNVTVDWRLIAIVLKLLLLVAKSCAAFN